VVIAGSVVKPFTEMGQEWGVCQKKLHAVVDQQKVSEHTALMNYHTIELQITFIDFV
jgi:hypothetical protein